MSATKSLSPEQNRRIVELLHALKRDRFERQEDLAEALGVKQGTLSGVMNPKSGKGVGGKILAGLSRIAAPDLALIMGGGAVAARKREAELDTLSMARQAAENLAIAKVMERDAAWLAMRDVQVDSPSVEAFVQEAVRRTFAERPPRQDESKLTGTARPAGVDAVGTRYRKRRAAGTR